MEGMCHHCGGLIGEPNKAYGWAGKWCHCGQTQRLGETYRPSRQAEIDELRRRLDRLEAERRRHEDQVWLQFQSERQRVLSGRPTQKPSPILPEPFRARDNAISR